ncbi:MAG: response regulator, partial [Pseudomonadota bacterium]
LDVYMSGRDGWSILREIKTDDAIKDVPVAMVTQLSEEKFAESLGADGYFTKPIDRAVFVKEVSRLLGSDASPESKVLVVDDDKNTRELLSRILTDEGFAATTAEDGVAGLEAITSTLEDEDRPRLIVLDIEMPRMDGLQFLDAYAAQVSEEHHVPIVIFSGKDMSTTQQEILDQFDNVKGFVPKGDMSNLTSFISKLNFDKVG